MPIDLDQWYQHDMLFNNDMSIYWISATKKKSPSECRIIEAVQRYDVFFWK